MTLSINCAPIDLFRMSYAQTYDVLQRRSADWNFSHFSVSRPSLEMYANPGEAYFLAAGVCEILAYRGGRPRHVRYMENMGLERSMIDLWRMAPVERPKEILATLGSPPRSAMIDIAREYLDFALHAKQEVGISLRVASHYARKVGMRWADLVNHYDTTRTDYEKSLIEALRDNGGILSFDRFFELAMYGAMGTYTSETAQNLIFSKDDEDTRKGFFKTDAEDPLLADSLLHHARATWERLGRPKEFTLMEMGAGMGVLAENILKAISQLAPSDHFRAACRYRIVELSPALADVQRRRLSAFPEAAVECRSAFEGPLPRLEHAFVFSNELVDMFPMRKVTRMGARIEESYVAFRGGVIQEIQGPARASTRAYVEKSGIALDDGETYYVQPGIEPWIAGLNTALGRGVIVTLDYGGTREELRDRRTRFGKFMFRGFLDRSDPKKSLDGLALPTYRDSITGVARPKDLTVDVDVTAISASADRVGSLMLEGYMSQRRFTQAWREHPEEMTSSGNSFALILSKGMF